MIQTSEFFNGFFRRLIRLWASAGVYLFCLKAKFHYAIQVAHLVADPVSNQVFSDKFVLVCDQLATSSLLVWVPNSITLSSGRPGRRPTRTELVEIARTCVRSAFDPKKVASWSQTRTNLSKARSATSIA